jgi:sulfate adenylyltransferase
MWRVPVPQLCPSPTELDDVELLLSGAFAPTARYEPGGPARLTLPAELLGPVREAGAVELVDPEGLPLAHVEPVEVADDGTVTGAVRALATPAYGPFRRLHLTPAQVREQHPDAVVVPVAAPLTEKDIAALQAATAKPLVLLALTGTGTPQGVSPVGLVRATLRAAENLPGAAVVAVPLASHGNAADDHRRGELVVRNYAPGDVLAVTGQGPLSPDVEELVARDQPGPGERGLVVFFTGLSGSGKSTLARALHDLVLEQGERTVTSLDGDVVRRNLSAGLTFSREDRETNIRRIGWVAAEIARHGGLAICSPIAPFDQTRQQVRAMVHETGGDFVLVHVATPLAECERRDRKGLYAKARAGQIPEFTGISSPYEEPEDATVRVDTTGRTIEDALDDVLEVLYAAGHLAPIGLKEK